MRKLLFLLLITVAGHGQSLPSPTYNLTTTNTLKIKTPATVTSVNFLPTMEADFSLAKIDPVLLPLSTATKNYADKLTKGWYVSSINGNDSNLGNSERYPFLTIAKALTLVNDGDSILLECGSKFNETYAVTKNRLSLKSYGIGDKPIITGANPIATPTLVSGNVWTTTNNFGFGINTGRPVLFENGIAMQPVANTSECQALPGSYVTGSGDSFSSGNFTTQFHPYDSGNPTSNGKVYTANTRVTMTVGSGLSGLKIEGVEIDYSWLVSSMILNTPNGYVNNSTAKWGNKHNVFISDNSTAENVISYGAEMQGQYGRTATLFVAYSPNPVLNSTYSFVNCQAINDYKKVGQKQGLGLIGFLSHAGTGRFKTANFISCYGRGLDNSISSDAEVTNIRSCYFEKLTGKILSNASLIAHVNDSYFQGLRLQDAVTLGNINNYTNSVFIKLKVAPAGIGTLNFNNCLFFNEIKIGTASVENINFIDQTALPVSYSSFGCVYFNYNIMLTATTGAYQGDYNVFTTSSANQIRNVLSGTQYTTLSSWQTATGQDANSVYLTQAQQLTFFIQDPNTGNIIVNPQATVTSSAGTVYTGTFPDGTLLTDKFTNKMFAVNKSKYVELVK